MLGITVAQLLISGSDQDEACDNFLNSFFFYFWPVYFTYSANISLFLS